MRTIKEENQSRAEADPTVRRAIILSADMLGFSSMVSTAKRSQEAIDLADRLDRFAEQFSGIDFEDESTHEYFGKKYWAFSDSIVVCWYNDSVAQAVMTDFDADLDQLSGIGLAQATIMRTDQQLVRGGIAQGWILERADTVVGTALVTAAKIEKEIELPFIGVENSLYDHYRKHPVRRQYANDCDPIRTVFIDPCDYTRNTPALDYFMIMLGEIDLDYGQMMAAREIPAGEERDAFRNKCWWENRLDYVRWHRDFVARGLLHGDPRVQRKYDALRQHHNFRTKSLYHGDEDLLIRPAE